MPRPTRRLRLIAPGLSERLLRVRKVMGSPTSGCCCADVDDWVRILDNNSGFVGDDRESNDM